MIASRLLHASLALLLLALCSGCSLIGGAQKSILQASVGLWKLEPAALRDAQPDFVRGVYFNAEIMISDAADWRFFLDTRTPLSAEVIDTAHVKILVHSGEKWQTVVSPLRLISRHSDDLPAAPEAASADAETASAPADSSTAPPERVHHHVFALGDIGLQTWQRYQQQLWNGDRPKLRLPLTPRFSADIADQVVLLDYQFANSFAPAPLAPTVRLLLRMGGRYFSDEDFARLCNGNDFPYDKRALCGSTQISEDLRADTVADDQPGDSGQTDTWHTEN